MKLSYTQNILISVECDKMWLLKKKSTIWRTNLTKTIRHYMDVSSCAAAPVFLLMRCQACLSAICRKNKHMIIDILWSITTANHAFQRKVNSFCLHTTFCIFFRKKNKKGKKTLMKRIVAHAKNVAIPILQLFEVIVTFYCFGHACTFLDGDRVELRQVHYMTICCRSKNS